ncbi:MAG: hypothetical protein ACYDBH_14035 [Acidobacteriaceae bacterium]
MAVVAKSLSAFCGLVLCFLPDAAIVIGITILLLELASSCCFYFSDAIKTSAEPTLTRLDFEHGLGWKIPKEDVDNFLADFAQHEQRGRDVRGDDEYFSSPVADTGPQRLRSDITESALYTRTIALNARDVLLFILFGIVAALLAVLITGLYRHFSHGRAIGQELAVDVLIFLVAIDLVPLCIRYNALAQTASRTRDILKRANTESEVVPAVVDYQLARASAPLLPTFAFLSRRFPLSAIWSRRS